MYEQISAPPLHLEIDNCPHCGVAKPLMTRWLDNLTRSASSAELTAEQFLWIIYECSKCHDVTATKWYVSADRRFRTKVCTLGKVFPRSRKAAEVLPADVSRFLNQAFQTLHAPDAAIMLAASSVDAMLKEKGFHEGTLHQRLSNATEKGAITKDMKAWGDHVRLEANDVRHADKSALAPTMKQAQSALISPKLLLKSCSFCRHA